MSSPRRFMWVTTIGSKQKHRAKKPSMRVSATFANSRGRTSQPRVLAALSDLYQLLVEFAPPWFTEEHRRKAQAALFPKKIV
jgi:hypothetical protein